MKEMGIPTTDHLLRAIETPIVAPPAMDQPDVSPQVHSIAEEADSDPVDVTDSDPVDVTDSDPVDACHRLCSC